MNGASAQGRRASAIAAKSAGEPRGNGHAGKHGRVIGRRWRANRSATGKAAVIASASETGNNQHRHKQIPKRGSSLKIFFDHCCDRPGCYEGFVAAAPVTTASDSVRARAGGPWNAFGSANGVGARRRGAGGGFRRPPPMADNPDILIGKAHPAYIRPASERNEAHVLRWADENLLDLKTSGNRRTLRPLSSACAGSRARHGEIARTLRTVIAGGGVPPPGPL